MSAIAPIKASTILGTTVRTTDAAIGVNHTFDPDGPAAPGVTRWVDRSGGIAVGYPALTLSVRKPSKSSRIYRVTAKVSRPTLDTVGNAYNGITPGPSVAYSCGCVMEFMLPERSTAAERLALLNDVHSLFVATINASDDVPTDATGTPLLAAVQNFDQPY